MPSLILVNSDPKIVEAVDEAAKKYAGIFSTQLDFISCKSLNEVDNLITMGKQVPMMVINRILEPQEINTFHGMFVRKKNTPLIVATGEQPKLYSAKFTKNKVIFNAVMTKEFIFDCLRLYVADDNRKIDTRIFREILMSVVDVIFQNTKEKIAPLSVGEVKAKAEIHDISGVLAFYGEGIKGTLLIGTSSKLIKHLAAKMLYCEASDLTEEMIDDAMLEISSQLLGVVRNALSAYGYKLDSSMQLVVTGEQHEFLSSSTGHYYQLPFTCKDMDFKVTFCYDTYILQLDRSIKIASESKKRVFDARLLNSLCQNVPKAIESNTKISFQRKKMTPLKTTAYLTHSLHVIHGRGEEGGFLFILDIPSSTARKIVQKMLFCDESDITNEMLSDAVGEIANQIQGQQKKDSESIGYHFKNIFHCSFSGNEQVQYLMKNPGHYCRIEFRSDDGEDLICCYGLDSQFASNYFDVAEIIKSLPTD